ncbi:hypothetical protein B7494_g7925 [Chlorociboria aeruginascens]|nr:hypothetical protein B7494_g7925 [Chlorociboria aeruginascens]
MFWHAAITSSLLLSQVSANVHQDAASQLLRRAESMEENMRRYVDSVVEPVQRRQLSGTNLTTWDSETLAACTTALTTLNGVATNPSGLGICYNLPYLDNTTGVFQADLRLFSVSAATGQFANISSTNVQVEMNYVGASVSPVNASSLQTRDDRVSLISWPRDEHAMAKRASTPTMVQSYSFVGQINQDLLSSNMDTASLQQVLTPNVTLTGIDATGAKVNTTLSSKDATFVNGVFSQKATTTESDVTPILVNANPPIQTLVVASGQPFVVPGTKILIFPIGGIITGVWAVLFMATIAYGTVGRIQFRDQFRSRSARATKANDRDLDPEILWLVVGLDLPGREMDFGIGIGLWGLRFEVSRPSTANDCWLRAKGSNYAWGTGEFFSWLGSICRVGRLNPPKESTSLRLDAILYYEAILKDLIALDPEYLYEDSQRLVQRIWYIVESSEKTGEKDETMKNGRDHGKKTRPWEKDDQKFRANFDRIRKQVQEEFDKLHMEEGPVGLKKVPVETTLELFVRTLAQIKQPESLYDYRLHLNQSLQNVISRIRRWDEEHEKRSNCMPKALFICIGPHVTSGDPVHVITTTREKYGKKQSSNQLERWSKDTFIERSRNKNEEGFSSLDDCCKAFYAMAVPHGWHVKYNSPSQDILQLAESKETKPQSTESKENNPQSAESKETKPQLTESEENKPQLTESKENNPQSAKGKKNMSPREIAAKSILMANHKANYITHWTLESSTRLDTHPNMVFDHRKETAVAFALDKDQEKFDFRARCFRCRELLTATDKPLSENPLFVMGLLRKLANALGLGLDPRTKFLNTLKNLSLTDIESTVSLLECQRSDIPFGGYLGFLAPSSTEPPYPHRSLFVIDTWENYESNHWSDNDGQKVRSGSYEHYGQEIQRLRYYDTDGNTESDRDGDRDNLPQYVYQLGRLTYDNFDIEDSWELPFAVVIDILDPQKAVWLVDDIEYEEPEDPDYDVPDQLVLDELSCLMGGKGKRNPTYHIGQLASSFEEWQTLSWDTGMKNLEKTRRHYPVGFKYAFVDDLSSAIDKARGSAAPELAKLRLIKKMRVATYKVMIGAILATWWSRIIQGKLF